MAENAPNVPALQVVHRVEAPNINDAVFFYKDAFGLVEVQRTLNSAELQMGYVILLIKEAASPVNNAGINGTLEFVTRDVEGATAKAMSAGAVLHGEGDRVELKDPYGFVWRIRSH